MDQLSFGQVFDSAWLLTKKNMGKSILVNFIIAVLMGLASVPTELASLAEGFSGSGRLDSSLIYGAMSWGLILYYVVFVFLEVATIRIYNSMVRGQESQFMSMSTVTIPFHFYLRFVGAFLLLGIVVFLGLALCFLPGVYLYCRLWPVLYIIADGREMGVIDAFRKSWEMTEGNVMLFVVVTLVSVLLVVAGYVMCCVGIFFTLAIVYFMWAYLYDQLFCQAESSKSLVKAPQSDIVEM